MPSGPDPLLMVVVGTCLVVRLTFSCHGTQLCGPGWVVGLLLAAVLGTAAQPVTWKGEQATSEIGCRAYLWSRAWPSTREGHGRLVAPLFPSLHH